MLYKQRYNYTKIILVRNLLYFLAGLFLFSCNSILPIKEEYKELACPAVFFSSEHRNFLDSEENVINLDNLSIRANINNFSFNVACRVQNNVYFYPLDILIILEPLLANQPNIELPIYATLLDQANNLIENQYFSFPASLNQDPETNDLLATQVIKRLNIAINNDKVSSIIIGFMLDNEKKELLN